MAASNFCFGPLSASLRLTILVPTAINSVAVLGQFSWPTVVSAVGEAGQLFGGM